MKPHEILVEAAETFKTRNAVYKDNYKHIGPVMAGYFPEGIRLLTPTDYIRFHLFMLIHVKLTRYTNNWANGHQDSLRDISVYAAMLESVDAEELGELKEFYTDEELAAAKAAVEFRQDSDGITCFHLKEGNF